MCWQPDHYCVGAFNHFRNIFKLRLKTSVKWCEAIIDDGLRKRSDSSISEHNQDGELYETKCCSSQKCFDVVSLKCLNVSAFNHSIMYASAVKSPVSSGFA